MNTTLADLMRARPKTLIVAQVRDTVQRAVELMNDAHVGSVLVLDEDRLTGILTERDVLTRIVGAQVSASSTIGEIMTTPVLCVSPKMRVDETMRLMTDRRTRHLPVVDDGDLMGLVSIGDLTHWITRELRHSVDELSRYIAGPAVVVHNSTKTQAPSPEADERVYWGSRKHSRISVPPPQAQAQ